MLRNRSSALMNAPTFVWVSRLAVAVDGLGARAESCSRLFEDDQLVDLVDGVGLRLTIGPDDLERHRIVPLT